MEYITYYTDLNLQVCNYAQKQRNFGENRRYALDENLYGHFCSRRKAANFGHPVAIQICYSIIIFRESLVGALNYFPFNTDRGWGWGAVK